MEQKQKIGGERQTCQTRPKWVSMSMAEKLGVVEKWPLYRPPWRQHIMMAPPLRRRRPPLRLDNRRHCRCSTAQNSIDGRYLLPPTYSRKTINLWGFKALAVEGRRRKGFDGFQLSSASQKVFVCRCRSVNTALTGVKESQYPPSSLGLGCPHWTSTSSSK